MTHIEQMIQDLCPNGVEFKKLGELCTCTKGEQLNKSGLLEEGYPVINGGVNPSGYWNEYNYPANTITISQGGASAGYVNFLKTPFWAGAHCYVLIDTIPEVDYKFLYYFVKQNEKSFMQCQYGAGIPALGAKTVNSLEIPLPPLEIQKKIVECLDKFSALAAELQAELQKRRTQYEYYRTRLLTPPQTISPEGSTDDRNWEWKTLGEVCENCDYMRKPITATLREKGEIPYYGASGIVDYVKDYIYDGEYLLISEDGANLIARSTPIAFSIEGKNWVNNHAHVLKFEHRCTQKLVEYYINSINIEPYVSGGAQPKLNQANLNKIPIPIPSLAEQARIVSILDKFEALTTSLSDGIPAEQAAQQKRYEYYRDLLLTFDRKSV